MAVLQARLMQQVKQGRMRSLHGLKTMLLMLKMMPKRLSTPSSIALRVT